MKIQFLPEEYWYSGVVHRGTELPISETDNVHMDLVGGPNAWDQYSSLFLSSSGEITIIT